MRILVTGGMGFLGSQICDELLEQGHIVDVLDSGIAGVNFTPKGVASLKRFDLLKLTSPMAGTEAVVHCAARADVSLNWHPEHGPRERDTLMSSNVLGTAHLLEKCQGLPVVFLSTLAVYGDNDNCEEDRACHATSPYAASKLAGEALVQAYAYRNSKPWHIFRMGCVVGPRYHHGHVVDFVNQAHAKGSVLPLNDGNTKKSYVHARDVARAVSMAVKGDIGPGIYNAASGAWSPRDTIRCMGAEAITEWPARKTHGWIGDPMAVATGAKLRAQGWVPRESIEGGIKESIAGYNP